MAALALDHLALPIFEVEQSLEFYANVLGLPLHGALSGDDWDGKPWLMMMFGLSDRRQLVLVALRGAQREASQLPREARHFAFSVESASELAHWKDKLASAGVSSWNEDHGAQRSVYFEDPNGIVLEITTPPSAAAAPGDDAHAVVRRFLADSIQR